MPWRMKILGTGTQLYSRPVYLKDFDLDYAGGIGRAELTADPSKALQFETLEALFETWRTRSRLMPNRPYGDGGPNRPLTTYSISPEEITTEPAAHHVH